MAERRLVFRVHAIQRMLQRHVDERDIRAILGAGKVIEDYPDDRPYPSRLLLGWRGGRRLHVVAAEKTDAHETVIITVYEPNLGQWEPDFRRRRRP